MEKKPKVKLVGEDGNAFAIMARCKRAAREAKMPTDEWSKIQGEMMSGDYNHLLRTVMEYFDVEDDDVEDDDVEDDDVEDDDVE